MAKSNISYLTEVFYYKPRSNSNIAYLTEVFIDPPKGGDSGISKLTEKFTHPHMPIVLQKENALVYRPILIWDGTELR